MLTLGRALLERSGALPEHAQIVVEHLVAASAMGLHSHGIVRIPQYLAEIESGIIDPRAELEIVQTGTSRLSVDGRRGFGQVVGMRMVEALVPVSRATGIALANGRHLGHTGRIGAYSGGLGAGGADRARPVQWPAVAPFGGRAGRL